MKTGRIGRGIWAIAFAAAMLMTTPLGLAARATAPTPAGAKTGETGPVFVSGPWRIAVVAAVRQSAIDAVGLKSEAGMAWVLIVADVTNWGSDAAGFAVQDWALVPADGGEPGVFAPNATPRSALQLGTEPASIDAPVSIEPNQTRRFTVVYQIPEQFAAPSLVLNDAALPLAHALARQADLKALPPAVPPPALEQANVDQVLDGGRIKVSLPASAANRSAANRIVRLRGVAAPTGNDCFAGEASAQLTALAGDTVWLERDGATTDGAEVAAYAWVEGDQGKTLLNRALIAGGYAKQATGQPPARFADWLAGAEQTAKTRQLGLWGNCPNQQAAATTTAPTAPPTATAADPCAGASTWALASSPRLQRAVEMLEEFQTYDYTDPTLPRKLRQHAAEFADLADAQRAMDVPPAFAESNRILADAFAAWSDADSLAARGLTDISVDEMNQAVARAQDANDLLDRASVEFKQAARGWGLKV